MAEFAASRHGVVLRSQAASFGLTAPELRVAKERGWLTEPARGVLVVSGYPATWEQRLAIATAAGTAEPVVSNGAGGRLFALDSFASADGELTVLRPGRIPTSVSGGIVVHHTTVLDLCSANSPSQPNVAAADRPSSSSARPGRHGGIACSASSVELGRNPARLVVRGTAAMLAGASRHSRSRSAVRHPHQGWCVRRPCRPRYTRSTARYRGPSPRVPLWSRARSSG